MSTSSAILQNPQKIKKDFVASSMDEQFISSKFKDYQKFTRSYLGDEVEYASGGDETEFNISSGQA